MSTSETSRRSDALYRREMTSPYFRLGLTLLLAFAVPVACSPAPMPVSQSRNDPSSPFAPEGAPPASEPAATDGGTAVTYVCPMHPEVTSDTPGVCPKCNMKLVPKK
jgi:hypothetical protein